MGVLIADIFLIVIAGIVCSVAYRWTVGGGTEDLTQYVGVSFIIAANFSAIMTARQNYHLKRLIRPAKQIREVIIVWSGTYGLLAAVAFTMKISGDFSRGSLLRSLLAASRRLLFPAGSSLVSFHDLSQTAPLREKRSSSLQSADWMYHRAPSRSCSAGATTR